MDDYQKQRENNEKIFIEGLKLMRPDLFVLMQTIDETKVDYSILLQIIYSLERIATGTKYGELRIFIDNGVVTFIRGEESKKINTSILKEDSTLTDS